MVRFQTKMLLCVGGVWVGGMGCKKEQPPPPPAPTETAPSPAAAPEPVPPPMAEVDAGEAPAGATAGAVGSIEGEVLFSGQAPAPQPLKRGVDPVCSKTPMNDETVLVTGGKLANVLVRLEGAPASPAPTEPVVVDQTECMYRPRVQGAVKGQPLHIKNSDKTLHNVHSYEGTKTVFNRAQPGLGAPIETRVDTQGVLKLKCDVHPWMTGFVIFSDNAFFAVSGQDGSFKISNVPAGTYTLEAWHEKLGSKRAQVTVGAGEPARTTFTY
jgi:plastocyanin